MTAIAADGPAGPDPCADKPGRLRHLLTPAAYA